MVAQEKDIRLRCVLAASLSVLVLAECGGPGSGSPRMAEPSRSPPAGAAEQGAADPGLARGEETFDKRDSSGTTEGKAAGRPANCEPTQSDMLGPFYEPGAPVRTSVGRGHLLSGAVLAAGDCEPVRNARIEFWLANPRGEYDDAHRATVFSGQRGRYRFESNVPVPYGGRPPHIHVRATAPGFEELVTQHYPEPGHTDADFDLVLVPKRGR
jgi:protocatechuate 3,4-dioxygenase beta subunit